MTEEIKEEPKIWVVLQDVKADDLEKKLNEQAAKGYQAFRIDRYHIGNLINGERLVVYDVVMFNPVLLGEKHHADMAAMLTKAAATAASAVGTPH